MASTLQLNLDGFEYEDVYRASQLPLLDARFDAWLAGRDGALRARYRDYRNGGEGVGPDESGLLIAVACELEDFLVAAFGVLLTAGSLNQIPVVLRGWELVIGATLFGIGWGLSAACPGTAPAMLGEGKLLAGFTVLGIVIGTYLFGRLHKREKGGD